MENQIEIVKNIADEMIGIGGIPSNEEFYAEFDMRVREALRIHDVTRRSEQLRALLQKLLDENMCSVVGEELIEEALKGS